MAQDRKTLGKRTAFYVLLLRLLSVLAVNYLNMFCGCGTVISVSTVTPNVVDPSLTKVKLEYLRQADDTIGSPGYYEIFEGSFTTTWAAQRFHPGGMTWEILRNDNFGLANAILVRPQTQAELESLRAYVNDTAEPIYFAGPPKYSYHLYAVKGFMTADSFELTGVGGFTLNSVSGYPTASFIAVGFTDQLYYPKQADIKGHDVVHELGHLKADLSEYCADPPDPTKHLVRNDSVCVMSYVCLDGITPKSNCSANCSSPANGIWYDFCPICVENIKYSPIYKLQL